MNSEEQFDHDADSIQLTIEQAKHQVRLGEALNRLQTNSDFKDLIMSDYLQNQAARLGHLLSDPAMQTKGKRKSVIKEIEAVGHLLSYLRVIQQRADMAREAIRVNEEELRIMAQEQQEKVN